MRMIITVDCARASKGFNDTEQVYEIELTNSELRLAMQEYTEHNRCKPVPKVVHYADMGDITEHYCSECGAYLGRKGDVRDIVVYCRVCGHMLDKSDLK